MCNYESLAPELCGCLRLSVCLFRAIGCVPRARCVFL